MIYDSSNGSNIESLTVDDIEVSIKDVKLLDTDKKIMIKYKRNEEGLYFLVGKNELATEEIKLGNNIQINFRKVDQI